MFGWLVTFLFGKGPEIFDRGGEVTHTLPRRRWEAWSGRMKTDPQYNWRNHTGMQAGRRRFSWKEEVSSPERRQ